MIYLKWLWYCIPDTIMQIVGKAICWILPFFVKTTKNEDGTIDWKTDGSGTIANLPKWLSWFQTDDHDCDGDRGSWERHPGTSPWQIYVRRTAWFFRNTGYNFCINVLGTPVYGLTNKEHPADEFIVVGNPDASDTNGISGCVFRRVYRDNKCVSFQWYYIKHYSFWKITACVRIGIGWKLFGSWYLNEGKIAQHMMYFNPLKKFVRNK